MERELLINGIELHYRGLFDLKEIMRFVDQYLTNQGYNYHEKLMNEDMSEDGKSLFKEVISTKRLSEYVQLLMKLRFTFSNMKKVVVEKERKYAYTKGDITIIIDGWATTDFEERWTQKPWYYLLIALINKFVWPLGTENYKGIITKDSRDFSNELKSYLNLYRFRTT